jgi:hypothetical protein
VADVRVTGVKKNNEVVELVEVEVHGGTGRLKFAQGPGPLPTTTCGAFLIDDAPVFVALEGDERGGLVLPPPEGKPLPAVPPVGARDLLTEERALGLAPLLSEFADGLYTVVLSPRGPIHNARVGWSADIAGIFELDLAKRSGGPVYADLGVAGAVLIAGRDARGPPAFLIRPDVILAADGFVAVHHDRSMREAFARAPGSALDDAALRDAVAHLRAIDPAVDVGPFSEDRVEPAAQQARALAWDLRAEDGIESVSDPWRQRTEGATEFRCRAKVKSVTFEVAFASHDGRHIDEVMVRTGNRFRATGLRPAARPLARTLRQLADEGG